MKKRPFHSDLSCGTDPTRPPGLEQEWHRTNAASKHHGLSHPIRNDLCTATAELFTCRVPSLSPPLKAPFFYKLRLILFSFPMKTANHDHSPSHQSIFIRCLEYKSAALTPAPVLPGLGPASGQSELGARRPCATQGCVTLSREGSHPGAVRLSHQ